MPRDVVRPRPKSRLLPEYEPKGAPPGPPPPPPVAPGAVRLLLCSELIYLFVFTDCRVSGREQGGRASAGPLQRHCCSGSPHRAPQPNLSKSWCRTGIKAQRRSLPRSSCAGVCCATVVPDSPGALGSWSLGQAIRHFKSRTEKPADHSPPFFKAKQCVSVFLYHSHLLSALLSLLEASGQRLPALGARTATAAAGRSCSRASALLPLSCHLLPAHTQAASGMSVAILLQLAAEFEAQGAYAQAIKCLTPVCEAPGELPAVVGQASLRLARLLLAHFDNVPEAKSILLAAVSGYGEPQALALSTRSHLARKPLSSCCIRSREMQPLVPAPPLPQEKHLRQTQGHHLLKCEVWDALSCCHQRLGAVAAESGALEAGLKACRQGATSKDK